MVRIPMAIRLKFMVIVITMGFAVEVDAAASSKTLTVQDLVRGCKPRISFGILFPNKTKPDQSVFTLSTPSIVSKSLLVTSDTDTGKLPCLYHGVNTATQEPVFGHVTSGVLRSKFKSKDTWYSLKKLIYTADPGEATPFLVNEAGPETASLPAGPGVTNRPPTTGSQSRRKRSLKLESFNDGAARKVLELVLVADSVYAAKFGTQTIPRMMEIVNYANGVYQTFGVRIVLTNVIVLDSNPINMTQTVEYVLREFSVYKALNIKTQHDTAALLTPNKLSNILSPGVVQETTSCTWTNGLCGLFLSASVVVDETEPVNAAWLLSHAIGALLGFKNVEDVSGCTCPTYNGCIMNFNLDSSFRGLLNWSSCSVDSWRSQADAIWRSCLKDAPEAAFPSGSSASSCGNGIVEVGEQCDCGPSLTCKSTCCNASTCMFISGAECASGSCCNSTTCRLKPRGQVCRDADGPCDVAETCDGSTEWCPSDDRVHDGVECSAGAAFCYNGECKTNLEQCRTLFDSTAEVAPPSCFSNLNNGTNGGFCHWSLSFINTTHWDHSTTGCSASDSMCGLLHCTLPAKPTMGNTYTISDGSNCSSISRYDFGSSGLRSPGMVPDGSYCGVKSMCVNSSCQPVSSFTCTDCPSCHGNGVATRKKLCYCKPGFAPPDCQSAGLGGSLQSPCNESSCFTALLLRYVDDEETLSPTSTTPTTSTSTTVWTTSIETTNKPTSREISASDGQMNLPRGGIILVAVLHSAFYRL